MRQLLVELNDEKAKQIEGKIVNLEKLTSNQTKTYIAIKHICQNKKPLLSLHSENDKISELLHSMQSCIRVVKTASMIKATDDKTELMLVTSTRN